MICEISLVICCVVLKWLEKYYVLGKYICKLNNKMQFYIVGFPWGCPSSVSNVVTSSSASGSGDIVSKYDAPMAARTTNIDKTIWKELQLF